MSGRLCLSRRSALRRWHCYRLGLASALPQKPTQPRPLDAHYRQAWRWGAWMMTPVVFPSSRVARAWDNFRVVRRAAAAPMPDFRAGVTCRFDDARAASFDIAARRLGGAYRINAALWWYTPDAIILISTTATPIFFRPPRSRPLFTACSSRARIMQYSRPICRIFIWLLRSP